MTLPEFLAEHRADLLSAWRAELFLLTAEQSAPSATGALPSAVEPWAEPATQCFNGILHAVSTGDWPGFTASVFETDQVARALGTGVVNWLSLLIVGKDAIQTALACRSDLAPAEVDGFTRQMSRLIHDLTRRYLSEGVQQESERRRSEAYLVNVLRSSADAIAAVDLDGRITLWNRGAEAIFGWTAAEMVGREMSVLLPDDVRDSGERELLDERMRLNGYVRDFRSVRLNKSGVRLTVTITRTLLHDEMGDTIGFSLVIRDITEQARLEREIIRQRNFVEDIIANANITIGAIDLGGRILSMNRMAESVLGYPAADLIGQDYFDLVVPTRQRAEVRRIIWEGLRERGHVEDFEMPIVRPDGSERMLLWNVVYLRDEHEAPIGFIGFGMDVTEKRRLEGQLVQSEKLSAVGKLAAGIAHEVGNPLASVSSIAQMLATLTDDLFAREQLKLIQGQIDRIARTIRELVDFSRPASQTVEPVLVNHVVGEAVRIVQYDKRLKGRQIELSLMPELPPILAVFDNLFQVVLNLLLNAADAMEKRADGRLRVETERDAGGGNLVIRISDEGEGVATEARERLFEPFFTTKPKGKGSGLGLWVSYNIIHGLGGQITFDSTAGAGTTFTITLPVAPTRRTLAALPAATSAGAA